MHRDMYCQLCKKNEASIHVTEVHAFDAKNGDHELERKHLCEPCAGRLGLPHSPVAKKNIAQIWKMLQKSAERTRQQSDLACKECGLTLQEFRARGKLGCPACYEVFSKHLDPLLQRMHNSLQHVGRVPGLSEVEQGRLQRLQELHQRLQSAIRDEDYEDAAKLRDEIETLKGPEAIESPEARQGPEAG